MTVPCAANINMEVSLYHRTRTPNLCSPLPLHKNKITCYHPTLCASPGRNFRLPETSLTLKAGNRRLNDGLAVRCATGRKIEAQINPDDKEEWMTLMAECGEREGVVELLECLEREAIMGEDEGRDPTDYNRRAQIFDKSSRVFQALRERDASSRQVASNCSE